VPFERLLYVTPTTFLQLPLPRLTFLEIINEVNSAWTVHLLNSCTHLKTLVWRSNRVAGVIGGSKRSLASLQCLILHSISDLPLIVAPGITKLAIKDKDRWFTNQILTEILGTSASAPSIRELDLLDSPVTNLELSSIMDRCGNLVIFKLWSGGDIRTEAYKRLARRARVGYLNAPSDRLLEVQFSKHPPLNSSKARARECFQTLVSIGTLQGLTVRFDVDFYRLRVTTNLRTFDFKLDSADVRRLVADNELGSALIVVDHLTVSRDGGHNLFQFVLVLREKSVAERIRDNGLWVRNHFHDDVRMVYFRSLQNK
jgi:hypothetical protein